MKKQISGNGVKVANLFAVVAKIEGKIWTSYSIDKMKSENLLMFWDYKTEGLTLPVAKEKLLATIVTRKKLHDAKIKVGKSPVFALKSTSHYKQKKGKGLTATLKRVQLFLTPVIIRITGTETISIAAAHLFCQGLKHLIP